ncbi:MAG: winged helix-turn-helix transcriptional regulator [Marinibacterium sp.]
MKNYGQFCPIAKAAEVFCERWTALVIRNLAAGAHRFGDIRRGVPHMSTTLLSRRLKQLEAEGVVERRKAAGAQHWEYHLTECGAEFVPLLGLLGSWGQRWTRRTLADGELDLGLLTWGLEHCIDPTAFGQRRHVVLIVFSDAPAHKARHWFVCEDGALDYCITDPCLDVDLCLTATLHDLTAVYRGDISIRSALDGGRLDANGPQRMIARLSRWLNLGPLADIKPARSALSHAAE